MAAARSATSSRTRLGELGGRDAPRRRRPRRTAPARTSARSPATRRAASGACDAGTPEQLGDHQHRQRLGVRRRSRRSRPGRPRRAAAPASSRTRGRSRSTWPAVEGAGDRPPQPGVLRRLVLHHLVAVQQVERLEVVRAAPGRARSGRAGGPAAPRSPRRGRTSASVPDGSCQATACRPRSAAKNGYGSATTVGARSGQARRGRRVRTHPAAPRPSAVRRATVSSSRSGPPFSTAAGGSARTA